MLTKGAFGNLVNRYRAVLKKCNLINTFGSLAMASMLVLGGAGVASAEEFTGGAYSSATIKSASSLHGGIISTFTQHTVLLTEDINKFTGTIFSNNTVENSAGECNGGIIYNSKELELTGCQFLNNSTKSNSSTKVRGGVISNAGSLTITGCIFDGNTASRLNDTNDQYGSVIHNTGTMTINNSTFANSDGARAVYISEGSATLSGNTFEGNLRGCVQTESIASVTFKDTNTFTENSSNSIKNKGTATFVDGSVTTFTGNKVDIDNAGTVDIKKGGSVDMGSGMIGAGTVKLAGELTGVIYTEKETDKANTVVFEGGQWTVTGASTVNTMSGNGTIVIDNENAKISAQSDVQGDDITAKGSGNLNDNTGGKLSVVQNAVDGLNIAVTGMDEGKVFGAVDERGNMAKNTLMDAVVNQTSITTVALDKILTNDVRKRLGDIRSDKNESGVWMRWDGGKLKGENGLTNDFNTIQIGGDTKVGKNCRLGVAGSFTHGEAEFGRGNAELEGFTFSTYATWMGENGMFADVVARLGKFSNEMVVEGDKGDTDNRMFSLSGEYGWRLPVCDQFFLEPQVELAYTYVSSDTLELGDAKYLIDNMDSLTGRVGLVAGWNLPNDMGNVYARASVLHQFMGDAKITGTINGRSNVQKTDGDDSWIEYGIGANVKLSDKTYIWADVERTECADIDEEWRGTVGLRYSF